jgi:hypothetical protein
MSETKNTTIAEAKETKLRMELMIGDMLTNFHKQTGLYVERVNIEPVDVQATQAKHATVVAYNVEIDTGL